jgi:hypothetical protein
VLERGVFCISIDLELGWGYVDKPTAEHMRLVQRLERTVIGRVLEIFGKHEIPATWATVGRLLEREAELPDQPFAHVPAESWYAPDVLDQIHNARPEQEIGSHSYAHIIYSKATREQAAADLDSAARVHKAHGLEFVSFVYPDNKVNHVDLLGARGIKVFRTGASTETLSRLGRLGRAMDKFLPTAPGTVRPILHENGLVELVGCLPLIGRNGIRRLISPGVVLHKVRCGLDAAARSKSVFHFWFHPHNFYFGMETQFKLLAAIAALAAEMRRKRMIHIWPMKGFQNTRAV